MSFILYPEEYTSSFSFMLKRLENFDPPIILSNYPEWSINPSTSNRSIIDYYNNINPSGMAQILYDPTLSLNRNLLANSSFDVNTTGYNTYSFGGPAPTLTRQNAIVLEGTHSLRVDCNGTYTTSGVQTPSVTLIAGRTYIMSVKARAVTGTINLTLYVNSPVSSTTFANVDTTPTVFNHKFTPGSGGSTVLLVYTTTPGASFVIDEVQLELVPSTQNSRTIYYPRHTSTAQKTINLSSLVGEAGDTTITNGTIANALIADTTAGLVFDFTAANSYYQAMGSYLPQFTNGFTILTWVKPKTLSTQTLFSIVNATASNNRFSFGYATDGTLTFLLNSGNDPANQSNTRNSAASTVVNNTWQLLACTYDGGTNVSGMNLYKNGVNVNAAAVNNSNFTQATTTATVPIDWGRTGSPSSNFLNATVGITKIEQKQYSAAEVLAFYNLTKANYGL